MFCLRCTVHVLVAVRFGLWTMMAERCFSVDDIVHYFQVISATAAQQRNTVASYFFFSHPIYDLRPSVLPPSRYSDPGSHSRLFSPPTHCGSCLAFLSRQDFSSSSLVDSRRTALTHARRSQQLIPFYFCKRYSSRALFFGG